MFTGADLPAAVLERLAAYYGASLPLCFLHPFPSPDDARDAEHADVYDPAATRENIDPELAALYDALGPPRRGRRESGRGAVRCGAGGRRETCRIGCARVTAAGAACQARAADAPWRFHTQGRLARIQG